MPDIDEILKQGKRREARQSIALGVVIAAAGGGMLLAGQTLFGGNKILFAGAALVFGLGLIARGIFGVRTDL